MTHRHSFLGPWYFYSVCQHKRGFCHQFVCLICILPPGATATARPPSACGVTEATCNNGQCIDRLAFLVIYIWAEINRQRPNQPPSKEINRQRSNQPPSKEINRQRPNQPPSKRRSRVCDGRRDCSDGSDEARCRADNLCEPNEYQVGTNGKQTNRHRVRDGEQTNKQQVIAINLGTLRDLKHCYHNG